MCLYPNPQEPWVERPSLIPQETDITIWYQFSIRLLLFRNCFSCCRKRALPGSHRARGALARRRRHSPEPRIAASPPGATVHTVMGKGNRDSTRARGLDCRGKVTAGRLVEPRAPRTEHPKENILRAPRDRLRRWLSLPGHSGTVQKELL